MPASVHRHRPAPSRAGSTRTEHDRSLRSVKSRKNTSADGGFGAGRRRCGRCRSRGGRRRRSGSSDLGGCRGWRGLRLRGRPMGLRRRGGRLRLRSRPLGLRGRGGRPGRLLRRLLLTDVWLADRRAAHVRLGCRRKRPGSPRWEGTWSPWSRRLSRHHSRKRRSTPTGAHLPLVGRPCCSRRVLARRQPEVDLRRDARPGRRLLIFAARAHHFVLQALDLRFPAAVDVLRLPAAPRRIAADRGISVRPS